MQYKMKTLRELFKQYTPSEEIGEFFDSVKEYQVRKSKKRNRNSFKIF